MNPKPPIPRTGKSGWLGHHAARLKGLAVIGAVTLGFAGAGFAAVAPVSADPATQYVAVGSDTVQDIMNGFAFTTGGASGGTVLASYNATNPVSNTAHEIITPSKVTGATQTNCSFTRPNGSTEGFAAVDFSYNQTNTNIAQLAVPPGQGCIDLSRSSSAPGTVATAGPGSSNPSGSLIYVPFALDAVTGATGPTTSAGDTSTTIQCVSTTTGCTNVVNGFGTITFTPSLTNITTADSFTLTDLKTLYASCGTVSEGGITYNPVTATTGQQQIDLYAPQAGSGTLKFWASTLGFSPTSLPTCVHQSILAGPGVGVAVEEHDGSALASDPNGYAPISIAKWLSMKNAVAPDVRHDNVLHMINGISPFNSTGTKLNTSFPVTREVYLVMPFDRIVSGVDSNFDPVLSGLFAGAGSALCGNSFLIQNYGFATLSSTTTNLCGATSSTLRVQATTAGPS